MRAMPQYIGTIDEWKHQSDVKRTIQNHQTSDELKINFGVYDIQIGEKSHRVV